jgi:putative FmdB family regulatory protein
VPTYEYVCTSCERRFDVFQSFSEEPLTICEVCGGSLKKVFGSVGIMFKGSGFYKTDSRPAASSES